jgi:single-strand DNA-binding protein
VDLGVGVVVVGRLEQRNYQTAEGEARTAWDVTADEIGASMRYAVARPTKAVRRGEHESEDRESGA